MKIQDIHAEILSYFPNLPSDALHYTKNTAHGDFMINTFKYPHLIIPTIQNISIAPQKTTIYFTVDKASIGPSILRSILLKPNYGSHKPTGLFYIIEYSSPNIAKKFHPGHLRTTVLGNFIKNLCEVMGIKTHSINYLGDWGKQFGLLGVGFERFGCEQEMMRDPIKHLYDVYVRTNAEGLDDEAKAWFTDLETGKKENIELWQRFRRLSVEKYKELYEVLNCRFDEYSGESLYGEMGREIVNRLENNEPIVESKEDVKKKIMRKVVRKMEKYVDALFEKELLKSTTGLEELGIKDDIVNRKQRKDANTVKNSIKVRAEKNKIKPEKKLVKKDDNDESRYIETSHGKLCVLKNDGSTLYSTRDLAAAVDRIKRFNPDKIIYVVASQQDLYFKQLFECLHRAGVGFKKNESIFQHVNYGMVEGMSTRKGNVEFLEDIIDEARNVMLNKMKDNKDKFDKIEDIDKTAEILAVSALIVHDFDAKRIKNYRFNMNQCTEINGFTGPYLQYVHCRLKSIEDRNKGLFDFDGLTEENFDSIYAGSTEEKLNEIIFTLSKYPLTLEKCMVNYEPSTLVTYLMDLCKSVNGIVSQYKVLNEVRDVAIKRLVFYRAARIVLGNGLKVLGITPLDRM